MFTLAHELAHLWLGESALSDASLGLAGNSRIEKWCNRVAAEFLVPLAEIKDLAGSDPLSQLDSYKRIFKVSKVVILRRLLDADAINRDQFNAMYSVLIQPTSSAPQSTGGDFYNTLPVRASKRFVRALVSSTLEGNTTYRDAYQMLGINSAKTFRGIGQKVGVMQ
jgi:Zn-dependent peptidase ImmA (M78 family)